MTRAVTFVLPAALALFTNSGCGFKKPTTSLPSDPFSICAPDETCLAIELKTTTTEPSRFEECDRITGSAATRDCDGTTIKMASLLTPAETCVLPAYWTIHVPPLACLLTFDIEAAAILTDNQKTISAMLQVPGVGTADLGGNPRTKVSLILK